MSRDSIRRVSDVRILLDYRPALRRRTGVGEYIHETARALIRTAPAGESLSLFSSSWRDRLVADAVPGARSVDRRIPVALLNWLWHRRGWPPVEWLAGDADVVQAAHPLLIPATRAAQVVTLHDLDFLDHPERTSAEIRRDYPDLAADHARRADRVIAVSPHTAREVERRLGVAASRISICPPGAPDWRPRAEEPATGACILFVGALAPRKNLGMLLDAYERVLARLPAAPPLVLAGPVEPTANALIERTRRAPLAGHVELAGYVDGDAKRTLYARALVVVLPSHHEGFGLTAVEAMVTGVPVIAADRGALPDTVGAAGRLVPPDDAEAIAQAIAEVVEQPARRQAMRDAGLAHVKQFTWTNTAARTREAWAAAIDHRRSRRG